MRLFLIGQLSILKQKELCPTKKKIWPESAFAVAQKQSRHGQSQTQRQMEGRNSGTSDSGGDKHKEVSKIRGQD